MTDAARFEAFVREYQDMVFATAVRLLGNAADAEDVAQTAFLRAYERFGTIGSSRTAAGWLKTVTTNLCLNHLSRYRGRVRLFSEMDSASGWRSGSYASTLQSTSPDASDLEVDERWASVERALQGLPDHQRVPLVLFHFDDRSYEDIARVLGVTLGKVKTDIHRGRLALRQSIGARDGTD